MEGKERKIYTYEEALFASIEYFEGDELAAKVFVDKYALRDNDLNILEKTPTDMHWRIAKEFARIEKDKFKKPYSEEFIFNFLDKFKRGIMQGGPMFAIGNPYQYVSVGNCFVLPSPLDSYLSIMYTDTQIAQVSSRRGGVGWDISCLRPKNMKVKNAARTTSGAISFMKRFSNTIREVAQHGRRGASLQSISCYHPEILDFIKVKQDLKEVTGSNISIQFTDEFMDAVINNKKIKLRWPCTNEQVKLLGKKDIEFEEEVNAIDIWKEFIHSSWLMAEPGCIFIDTIHKDSPGFPYGYKEICCNPCGEQSLPKYSSCRLLALNLYGYVRNRFTENAYFDFEFFKKDVSILQRLGDDLVDIEIECIDRILNKIKSDPESDDIKKIGIDLWENIRKTALLDRRTGCGFTGLGDTIAGLNMRYASDESIVFVENLQKTFALESYRCSVQMAKELSPFPEFNAELDLQSGFVQKIKEEDSKLFQDMQKYGRRNTVLLTIAPCGSISCLTQTSSGLEPVFNLSYMRRKKGNPGDEGFRTDFIDDNNDHWMHFTVYHKGLSDWMQATNKTTIEESPYYKSTANEIDWINRVKLQSSLQKWVDNSISSTLNLPNDISEEKISEIYIAAYNSGCKGLTIYREGSRTGVLVNETNNEINQSDKIIKTTAPKRPDKLKANMHHLTLKGMRYYVAIGLLNEDPYEVFASLNHDNEGEIIIPKSISQGSINKLKRGHYVFCDIATKKEYFLTNGHSDSNADALTRLISTSLRHGADVSFITTQLSKVRGDMNSFAKAISRIFKLYIIDKTKVAGVSCPQCGSDMIFSGGCSRCSICDFSKCD